MNERIKELAEQAGLTTFGAMEIDKFIDLEFFAELIRADERAACAVIADRYDNGRADNAADLIANEIRQRGEK